MKTATLTLATLLLSIPAAHGAQNIDQSLPTGATPKVEVSVVQGKVTVIAWDRQEVKVTGTIGNDEHRFEMTGDARRVSISVRANSRNHNFGRRDDAILDVRVPSGAALDVQTVSADIDARGVRGAQRLESVSGNIATAAFDQPLDLQSISGNVDVNGSGGKAAVYAESTSGDVKARGLAAAVQAQSTSGNLELAIGVTPQARFETVSGNVVAALTLAEGASLDIESISGDVKLTFGQPVNGEFDVESFSGDIGNCFGPRAERSSRYTPGTELHFTQGSGSARVSIETLSGDIDFCDK